MSPELAVSLSLFLLVAAGARTAFREGVRAACEFRHGLLKSLLDGAARARVASPEVYGRAGWVQGEVYMLRCRTRDSRGGSIPRGVALLVVLATCLSARVDASEPGTRTIFNPISQLASEIESLLRSTGRGALAMCSQAMSCGSADQEQISQSADRMDATVSALTSYLPGSNAELQALLARAVELQVELRRIVLRGGVSPSDLALLEDRARSVLSINQPEPPASPVDPTLLLNEQGGEVISVATLGSTGGATLALTSTCDPEDSALLAQTEEVQFTPELDVLLSSLQNDPLLVYQFVRDEIRFVPYYGSRRNSSYVLQTLAGNDFDKASLLIAAYRRLGIPACYVRGTISLRADQPRNWFGVDSDAIARNILTRAFIPNSLVGETRVEHVWVEAYLDIADYRGASNSIGGKDWVPLAPAFYAVQQNGGPNLAGEISFDGDAFLQTAISGTSQGDPGDAYLDDLRATVATNHPGEQLDQVLWDSIPIADALEILPLSLPFRVVNRIEESSEVPEFFRHKLTITAGTLSSTLNLSAVAGRRITIAYVPATPADEAIVAGFGNIFDTPANLINVRAQLNLDGTIVASGASQPFGSTVAGSITIAANGYPTESIFTGIDLASFVAAGRHAVIVLPDGDVAAQLTQSHANVFRQGVESIGTPGFDSDETLGEALFVTGIEYFRRQTAFHEVAARSMQFYLLNASVGAIVSPAFALFASGGQIVGVEPRGVTIDAKTLGFAFIGKGPTSADLRDLLILASLQGSSLEHIVLEQVWGIQAVSTTRILQLANDFAVPILLIDASNRGTLVPQLTHPATTIALIESYLDAGFVVRSPRDPITYHDWSGTGFRAELPSGTAAGVISGGLFGGSIAEISEQIQELVRSGEITQAQADAFLFALFEQIKQPVNDSVTSGFGQRRNPVTGEPGSFHEGIDYASPLNTNVRSVADGIIEARYSSTTFGFTVIVNHGTDVYGSTYYTVSAHNNSFSVDLNEFVGQGDVLALSGNTGTSTGPHVHFEVRVVPIGVLGPVPNASGAPTNGAFFDQELAVDPADLVWPDLTLQCSPGC